MKEIRLDGKTYPVKTELTTADREAMVLNYEGVCEGDDESYFLMCRANLAIMAPSTAADEKSFTRGEVMLLWSQALDVFIEMMRQEAVLSQRLTEALKHATRAWEALLQRRNLRTFERSVS